MPLDSAAAKADRESSWWWEALATGVLMLPRCNRCDRFSFPPMPTCPHCGGTSFARVEASSTGRVYSWVVVHVALDSAFADEVPYTIAAVSLDEGARMFGRIIGPASALCADAEVRAVVMHIDGQPQVLFELK